MTFTNIAGGENLDQTFTGTGPLDSLAQTVKSIAEHDWLSAFSNAAVGTLDTLDAIQNPTKAIAASVIGWLLEHISFLDNFLDWTAGDANAVADASDKFHNAAAGLDEVAANQITAFGTRIDTYRRGASQSAQAFETRVAPRGDQLKALSLQCLGLGKAMNTAGVMVSTLRGVIRDLLTEFTMWVFKKAQVALALAPYTAGGSLATLATETCISGARLAKDFVTKLGSLSKAMLELITKVAELFAPILTKNVAPSLMKGFDDVIDDDNARLSQSEAAEQKVAIHEAPDCAPGSKPAPPSPPSQAPGLGVKWTASGTLY